VKYLSPSFSWDNWTSTIKNRVLIHPNYSERERWPGQREISDIRFNDTRSFLTQHLINGGYLDGDVWSGATPEYFIEVKTTTGDCGDRFFMSSNQYRLVSAALLFHFVYQPVLTTLDARNDFGRRSGIQQDICNLQGIQSRKRQFEPEAVC
jgi:hypothetical protein